MPSSVNWPIFLGIIWAITLLGLFSAALCLNRWFTQISLGRALLLVAMVALCVRLIPNLFLPMGAGYDIESYQIVGNLVLHKENVYTSQEAMRRHPYLPLQMYWMAFSLWFAQTFNLPFVKIVRLAPIFADAGIATWITLRLHNRLPLPSAFRGGLLYALNPLTVFVSAYHGQFDAIPVLLTLVAIEVIEVSPLGSGLVLGLGILDKSWPVLALPSLLAAVRNWRQRFYLALGCVLIPALGTLAYALFFKASLWAIIHRAISYDWGIGVWGYTYFFHLLSVLNPAHSEPFAFLVHYGRYITLTLLGGIWLWWARKEPVGSGVLTILVAFFAVTHAFSIQYLTWPVAFAVLDGGRRTEQWLLRYTLGAFAYMLLTYFALILTPTITNWMPWKFADTFIIRPLTLPVWLVAVVWLVNRLRTNASTYE